MTKAREKKLQKMIYGTLMTKIVMMAVFKELMRVDRNRIPQTAQMKLMRIK